VVGVLKRVLKLKEWLNLAPKAMQLTAMLLVVFFLLPIATSQAETRKLKLHFLHTGEKAEITYKKNGRYIQGGLKKINRFLRDWRRNEPTKMDPRLLDLIWEVYQETGSRKHINVISGYRSPKTNSLLRKRGRGVAKKSQHTLGKALDFFIPGVKLSKLRAIGLRKGLGGVGYYPRSGSPFVHMDTGRVRHWPRMSRKELVRVFPRGKTLHVPTDGKPLPGYDQAKRDYERKLKGKTVIASAAEIRKKPSILKKLFNREDEDEGVQTNPIIAKKPVKAPTPAQAKTPTSTLEAGVPVPANAQPATTPGVPIPQAPIPANDVGTPVVEEPAPIVESPETVIAALLPAQLPVPQFSPRVLAAATNTENNAEQLDSPEIEPVEFAEGIPVPTRSPNLAPEAVVIASTVEIENTEEDLVQPEEEKITLQPVLQVTALSPSEIEDIRNEISTDAQEENNITLLSALRDNDTKQDETSTAGNAIIAQLTSSTPTVTEVEPTPTITNVNEVAGAPVLTNIPVPTRNPIIVARAAVASTQPTQTAFAQPQKSAEPVGIQERMIGQWAFSTDTSIQTVSKIEPISSTRSIFRNLPTDIGSTGFSVLNQNTLSTSFSGGSN